MDGQVKRVADILEEALNQIKNVSTTPSSPSTRVSTVPKSTHNYNRQVYKLFITC